MILFSVMRAERRFDVQKKMTKLPELEGGAYLIRAMPERKRVFINDIFPNSRDSHHGCNLELLKRASAAEN